MNTRFEYRYRDGENYKKFGEVVIKGEFTLEQLQPHLYEGDFFVPSEIGLEDLQEHPYQDYDHVWHELDSAEPTEDEPTVELTAEEIVSRFSAAGAVEWKTETVFKRMMETTPGEEIALMKALYKRLS
jgi:hypothetical protein